MNYLSYYNLEFNPFDKALDTKHKFETEDYKIAYNRLNHIKENKGLALFTGAAGYGKTFCVRSFISSLNTGLHKCIYISLSTITVIEFYRQLCYELGIEETNKKVIMFRTIQERLIEMSRGQRMNVMIFIDEAQYLKTDILNDLKMLLNFEVDSKNYVTIVLMGQPVLNNILSRSMHEPLRQRITVSYNFSGITKVELKEYIESRLKLAGASQNIFNENAINAIYDSCNYSLRIVNNIIEKALIISANKQLNEIDNQVIIEAYEEIQLG
ncbi:MAG: AAA family ATPase [Bacilli bacterium]